MSTNDEATEKSIDEAIEKVEAARQIIDGWIEVEGGNEALVTAFATLVSAGYTAGFTEGAGFEQSAARIRNALGPWAGFHREAVRTSMRS